MNRAGWDSSNSSEYDKLYRDRNILLVALKALAKAEVLDDGDSELEAARKQAKEAISLAEEQS